MKTLPAPSEMYQALLTRDANGDGLFVVGVRTTGIFCRPTCPARKPLPENVEYFPTTQAALRAGYRPCQRCRPLELPGTQPEWAERLLALLQRTPAARVRDDDLRRMSIEPTAARRHFRERFGVTFQQYQRTQRLGLALNALRNGHGTLEAGLEVGFESSSGFRTAFERVFGLPPGRARGRDCITATLVHTPIGSFVAAASSAGVCLFEFADRPALRSQTAALQRWFDLPIVPGVNAQLEQLLIEVREYFAGVRRQFDVPLATAGTPFQQAVWRQLLDIPFGATRSYEDIATAIGRPRAVRAVGRANGDNRLAILIPCHRVVRKDGHLCGYGGSLWRKRWLLEHETHATPPRPTNGQTPTPRA